VRTQDGAFEGYMRLTVKTDKYDRSVAGTVFADGRPRIIQVRDINMEFETAPHMLFVRNADKPGFIGRFGTLMGESGLNIATLNLGRDKPGWRCHLHRGTRRAHAGGGHGAGAGAAAGGSCQPPSHSDTRGR
jgi:hypothetical protein